MAEPTLTDVLSALAKLDAKVGAHRDEMASVARRGAPRAIPRSSPFARPRDHGAVHKRRVHRRDLWSISFCATPARHGSHSSGQNPRAGAFAHRASVLAIESAGHLGCVRELFTVEQFISSSPVLVHAPTILDRPITPVAP
jgi:hypothetical protein